jgi:superfamily II RNA helicase
MSVISSPKGNVHLISPNSEVPSDYQPTPTQTSKTSHQLDRFQQHAEYHLQRQHSILVTAHTGSGKTQVARSAIQIAVSMGKKVFYTSPIKALSNQKLHEFSQLEVLDQNGTTRKLDLGLLTGDIKLNPQARDCVIMTTEILCDMMMTFGSGSGYGNGSDFDQVEFIVFDEIHYIKDPARGKYWETCIIHAPKHISLIGLSGSLPEPERFAEWISTVRQHDVYVISTLKRPVPLTHYAYAGGDTLGETSQVMDANNQFNQCNYDNFRTKYIKLSQQRSPQLLNPLISVLIKQKMLPAMVFTFSRHRCWVLAHRITATLATPEEAGQINKLIDFYIARSSYDSTELEKFNELHELRALLIRGIGVHHAHISPILREIVELLTARGLCKLLICTETFAMGFNAPMKAVIFTELEKWDGQITRPLRPDEYLQMAGRAGRRGLDQFGVVIYSPEVRPNSQTGILTSIEAKSMMTGHMISIESQYQVDYDMILQQICTNKMESLTKSYLYYQNQQKLGELQKEITQCEMENKKYVDSIHPHNLSNLDELNRLQQQLNPSNLNDMLGIVTDPRVTIKPSKSLIKKLETAIKQLIGNYECLSNPAILTEYQKYRTQLKHLEMLKQQQMYLIGALSENYVQGCRELCELGYLIKNMDMDTNTNTNMYTYRLTEKGQQAVKLRSVDCIMMTELLQMKWFQELNITDLAVVLSIFCDQTGTDTDDIRAAEPCPQSNLISPDAQDTIDWIFGEREAIAEYPMYRDYAKSRPLGTNFVNLVQTWVSKTPSYVELTQLDIYQNYKGNVIVDFRRLAHIIDELIAVCEVHPRPRLEKNLRDLRCIVMRDFVAFDSLYLKI